MLIANSQYLMYSNQNALDASDSQMLAIITSKGIMRYEQNNFNTKHFN